MRAASSALLAGGLLALATTESDWEPQARSELARQWQGAWLIRDATYPGSVEAWRVERDHVDVYDAVRDQTYAERFALASPCRIARTRQFQDGSELVTYDSFVFAADGLHIALAPANGGWRRDDVVAACIGENVYTYRVQGGQCRRWDASMTAPAGAAAVECAVVHNGGASSFVVRALEGGDSVRLDFYGTALLSQELLAHRANRRPNFDDAKRAAAGHR